MRETTTQLYIDAHDAAWGDFNRWWHDQFRLSHVLPSKWDSFAAGFAAGVQYGRDTEPPVWGADVE